MLLKVRALTKLKVNMVEKCTSEMFVLGVVETSSYILGGRLLLMYLSSISQICLIAYGHIV